MLIRVEIKGILHLKMHVQEDNYKGLGFLFSQPIKKPKVFFYVDPYSL